MDTLLQTQRAQRGLALARSLADIVLTAGDAEHTTEALRLALEGLCTLTGWGVGHAWLTDEEDGTLCSSTLWAFSGEERFEALQEASQDLRLRVGEGLPGRVVAKDAPVWITDIEWEEDFPRAEAVADLGVRGAFAFPVRTSDGTVAVLEFFSPAAEEPDAVLLDTVVAVSGLLGRVFDRVAAAAELREREARFRALAENASEAIVTIDPADRILFANPATARIFGYAEDELLQMSFSRLMPERFRQRHQEGLRHYQRTGRRRIPWDGIELPGLHRDGHEIPLEVTFGEFSREGRRFFTGIMRDIRERRRAEEERAGLLEREQEARTRFERLADEERALREASAGVVAAYTTEEAARRIAAGARVATRADGSFVERIDVDEGTLVVVASEGEPAPPVGARRPFAGSLTERAVRREEPQIVRAGEGDSAREAPYDVCAGCSLAVVPLLDSGSPVGALVLVRSPDAEPFHPDEVSRAHTFGDLASLAFRRIHLLEESERRREELQRIMDSRDRLMRGFTHDVKNPLGAAQGYLELLLEGIHGPLGEGQALPLERARGALDAALSLIDDLLELGRAEAGMIEVRAAPTDLREAAREVAEEYRAQAEQKGQDLVVELPGEYPTIRSDPARVRQVLGNLVSNAVKYTPEGGRIVVEAGVGDATVWVRVEDDGPGVPPDKHELLFEEFTRLGPEGGPQGAGIGLAISRRIARALDGDIELDSVPGRGSTFRFRIPLRRIEEEEAGAAGGGPNV